MHHENNLKLENPEIISGWNLERDDHIGAMTIHFYEKFFDCRRGRADGTRQILLIQ